MLDQQDLLKKFFFGIKADEKADSDDRTRSKEFWSELEPLYELPLRSQSFYEARTTLIKPFIIKDGVKLNLSI